MALVGAWLSLYYTVIVYPYSHCSTRDCSSRFVFILLHLICFPNIYYTRDQTTKIWRNYAIVDIALPMTEDCPQFTGSRIFTHFT